MNQKRRSMLLRFSIKEEIFDYSVFKQINIWLSALKKDIFNMDNDKILNFIKKQKVALLKRSIDGI